MSTGEPIAIISAAELAALIRQVVRAELDRREGGTTLSTEEAAAVAGCDPKTVRRWITSDQLPARRRGRRHRIRRDELEKFLAGGADKVEAATSRILASLDARSP